MSKQHAINDNSVDRFAFFSDAVFAIAITLLALELKLPETTNLHTSADVLNALHANASQFFGFILSFVVIAMFWKNHVSSFRNLIRYDSALINLNIFMLLLVAFMPFTTSLISDADNNSATVIIYALNISAIGIVLALMWRHISINKLSDGTIRLRRGGYTAMLVMAAVFIISIPIALIDSQAATYSWLLLIPLLRFIH